MTAVNPCRRPTSPAEVSIFSPADNLRLDPEDVASCSSSVGCGLSSRETLDPRSPGGPWAARMRVFGRGGMGGLELVRGARDGGLATIAVADDAARLSAPEPRRPVRVAAVDPCQNDSRPDNFERTAKGVPMDRGTSLGMLVWQGFEHHSRDGSDPPSRSPRSSRSPGG